MSHENCVVENEYTLEPVFHNIPRHGISVASNGACCHPAERADAVYAIPRRCRVTPNNVEHVYQNYEPNIRNNPMRSREKHHNPHLPADHERYASSGDVVTQEPENIYDIPFHSVRRRSEQAPAVTVDEVPSKWQKLAGLLVVGLVAVIFVTAIVVTTFSKGSNQQGEGTDGSPTTNLDMTLQAATGIKTTQENGVIKTTTSESTKGTTFTTANAGSKPESENESPFTKNAKNTRVITTAVSTLTITNESPFTTATGVITSEISASESKNEALFTAANDLCQVTYEGICFWFGLHSVQDIDFPTAQDICAQRNYEVADIYSEEHYKLIVKFLHSAIRDGADFVSAWIGLQIDLQTNVVALSDGRVAPYVNWYRAPQFDESIHLIVSSDSHGMSSVPANTSLHAVVCQSKQLYIQIPEDRCHVEYRGLCFWASVGVTALTDFPLAQNICASAGSDVANIYDDEHYNIVVEYLFTVMPSKLNFMWLWTGMRYDEEASRITFSDGNTVPYRDAWFMALPTGSATHICMILGEFDFGSTLYGTSPLINNHGVICQTWGNKSDGD